jgi:hypothetical protein
MGGAGSRPPNGNWSLFAWNKRVFFNAIVAPHIGQATRNL